MIDALNNEVPVVNDTNSYEICPDKTSSSQSDSVRSNNIPDSFINTPEVKSPDKMSSGFRQSNRSTRGQIPVVDEIALDHIVTSQKYTSSRSSSKGQVQTPCALGVKFKC